MPARMEPVVLALRVGLYWLFGSFNSTMMSRSNQKLVAVFFPPMFGASIY
jgi:hypothetical protein